MDNQKVLFYFLVLFVILLFITTFSNIYNSKVNEITEGFIVPGDKTAKDLIEALLAMEPFTNNSNVIEEFQNPTTTATSVPIPQPPREYPIIKLVNSSDNEFTFLEGLERDKFQEYKTIEIIESNFIRRFTFALQIVATRFLKKPFELALFKANRDIANKNEDNAGADFGIKICFR